jgi:hypothetical protein
MPRHNLQIVLYRDDPDLQVNFCVRLHRLRMSPQPLILVFHRLDAVRMEMLRHQQA